MLAFVIFLLIFSSIIFLPPGLIIFADIRHGFLEPPGLDRVFWVAGNLHQGTNVNTFRKVLVRGQSQSKILLRRHWRLHVVFSFIFDYCFNICVLELAVSFVWEFEWT